MRVPDDNKTNTYLWSSCVAFYGCGDLTTTYVGISHLGAVESNTIPSLLLSNYGWIGFILLKVSIILFAFLIWKRINYNWRIGIPIGLTVIGATVTMMNSSILLRLLSA